MWAMRRVLGEKFIAPRMARFRTVFERAVAQGETPAGRPNLLARLLPALGLRQIVSSGELPGTRLACQVMDEVVYPPATGRRPDHPNRSAQRPGTERAVSDRDCGPGSGADGQCASGVTFPRRS
jgi:hypothetical protein